jgi:putative transposase
MAWESYKVEHQRLQLVQAYESGEADMTKLCKHYNVSRKTAYKWYLRYREQGVEGLKDRSRAPLAPHQHYTDCQIDRAVQLKHRHKTWGPKKIVAKLQELYPNEQWPCPTRLYEIFKELHLVTSRKIRSRVPATAPLGDLTACNGTWAVDLKGWFLTGNGYKCEPLTITDCFTRYLISCTHLDTHTGDDVWPIFDEAFRKYGLPERLRSDNGPPFGCKGVGRLTSLSVKLIKAGVIPEWINPGCPEENGRHERFHLTLKQDVASPPKETLALQIKAMKQFEAEYNFERPHEAINMKTPGSIYHSSPRKWNGILQPPEYDRSLFEVRKVETVGRIYWQGGRIFIGEALRGEYVGLKPSNTNIWECYYGPVYLGQIGPDGELEKPKMPRRRKR